MIELEDNVGDIVGKAQRGLGISDNELAQKSGANADAIRKARDGQAEEATLRAIAPVLDLDANALIDLAQGKWKPDELENFEGLAQFNTSYSGMLVNAYLVWDPVAKHAAAFDTGADSAGMLKLATKENLNIKLILLTHAHPDHVADLPRLREETGTEVFAPERDDLGTFTRRYHFCCDWPCGADRDCGRFALCRLDGRGQRFLQRRGAKQSRKNPDVAG